MAPIESNVQAVPPADSEVEAAAAALERVREYLARHPASESDVRLHIGEAGEEALDMPRSAVVLLARVLAHMANGHAVAVVPTYAELTTQQAADLLNVSRPYLIRLLEAGEIDYRMVGVHRRVNVASLLAYRRADDARRRAAADELSAEVQELGLD